MSTNGPVDHPAQVGVVEFVSPFALDVCAERLRRRHEPTVWLAWDWQTRLWVQVTPVDAGSCRFTLKRVSRSKLELPVALGEVHGELRALGSNRTVVSARQRLGGVWWLALVIFGAAVVTALAASLSGPDPLTLEQALQFVGVLAAGAALILGIMVWVIRRQMRGLMAVLRDALGGQG